MYHYYTYDGRTLCSAGALPYPEISALPETGEVLWVFHRPPLAGRDTFPVTAPALSSGALSLLRCLRGQWHCSSTYLGGVFMGARNRVTAAGTELERLPLPRQLQDRLQTTMDRLRAID